MRVTIEDLKAGWYDISIGLKRDDIKELISLFNSLLNVEIGQHFHLASNYRRETGVADIEIYLDEDNAPDNLSLTSFAISSDNRDEKSKKLGLNEMELGHL